MKISVLGTGRWASTNIWIAVRGGHTVKCWDKFPTEFMQSKKNRYVDLSESEDVTCCSDLAETLNYSDIVIISILSQELDNLMKEVEKVKGYENKKYCLAMKGVEAETGRTLSEIMIQHGVNKNNIAILAGPGQPDSIAENKRINKMVVSSYDYHLAKEISEIIKTENFKLFPWPDVQGCELCAAAKNVYSALGGMCEGAEQTTLKGQIMSVSMHEMQNFLKGMHCNPETVIHLSLLADYNATLYDPISHNLNYGIQVVKQNNVNPELDFNSIEGKYAVAGLLKRMALKNQQLSDYMQIKAPLMQTFKDIVDGKINPRDIIPNVNNAIDLSLEEWTNKSFDL